MSKRVANSRSHKARNGRTRYNWRKIQKARQMMDKKEITKDVEVMYLPKISLWQRIINYIRRRCGKQ